MKTIIFILLPYYVFLQNLVPNPSFEDNIECPTIFNSSIDLCVNWLNAQINGSPDYFSICGGTIPVITSYDYQLPLNGGFYSGIWSFKLLHQGQLAPNLREYIRTQLITPLEVSRCYYVSMYVNNINWSICGINNMGITLSLNPLAMVSQETYLLNGNPQVYSKKSIADTLNWVKISGIIQAQGGEEYLTIGNFFQDSLTEHIEFLNIPDYPTIGAYYLIDDVTVIPIDSIPGGMTAYAGTDTTIFIGDSLLLGQDVSNLSCTWYQLGNSTPLVNTSPYESSIFVFPTDTTTYVVEQNLCGTITFDTVKVNIVLKTPVISANAPLNLCSGDSVVLTVDASSGIVWSPNGETTPSITVSTSGTYFVTHTFNEYTAVSQSITTSITTTPQPTLSSFPEMCDTNATFIFTEGSPAGGIYTVNGVPSLDFDPISSLIGDHTIEYSLANGNCVGTASTVLTVVGCTVGLDDTSLRQLTEGGQWGRIFPNPNNGTFTIVLSNTIGVQELNLVDEIGRKVKILEIKSSEHTLQLSKGIYFLEVKTEQNCYSEKIVVN